MTTVRKTYYLNKRNQLIDLNEDRTNFDITFRVDSKNGEPFDIVVADQTTLDNSPQLEYKNASTGTMSGNIVQDKNIYQNYFLVLKAEQPCEVTVEITTKDIPGSNASNFTPPVDTPEPKSEGGNKKGFGWKWLILIGIAIGGGILLWYIWNQKKKNKSTAAPALPSPSLDSQDGGNMYDNSPLHSPVQNNPEYSASPEKSPSPVGTQNGDNDLLARLKKLHM